MSDATDDQLQDLPPSAKLVYKVLDDANRPLNREEIKTEAHGLAAGTLQNALDALRDAGLVDHCRDLSDPHRHRYFLIDE